MNLISKENSIAKTPVTDNEWQNKSDIERVKLIQNFLFLQKQNIKNMK